MVGVPGYHNMDTVCYHNTQDITWYAFVFKLNKEKTGHCPVGGEGSSSPVQHFG